jgi:hypothetical protein
MHKLLLFEVQVWVPSNELFARGLKRRDYSPQLLRWNKKKRERRREERRKRRREEWREIKVWKIQRINWNLYKITLITNCIKPELVESRKTKLIIYKSEFWIKQELTIKLKNKWIPTLIKLITLRSIINFNS